MYTISSTIYKGGKSTIFAIISMFLRYFYKISLTFGGVLLGLFLGLIVAIITKRVYNDTILCINATIVTGFLGYFIAETFLKGLGYYFSGIMTLISIGLFMSNFVKKNFKGEC